MRYYSTNNKSLSVSAKEAVLAGLAPDGGLYMPSEIPKLPAEFFRDNSQRTLAQIGEEIAKIFLGKEVEPSDLHNITTKAISFDAPLIKLGEICLCLELFHGPTLAFKDFAARFMAQLMSYFRRGENKHLDILVATSGDTGSAVANGFFNVPGIHVTILYPSGKVTNLQEKQLTTLGGNITALEVKGTFDDCQQLVKQAFVDSDLLKVLELSSANSINIARLIPQSFYYAYAASRAKSQSSDKRPIVFSVPSGNFGNLTAGLIAKALGLEVSRFIASTNANDVVVEYLKTGEYKPRKSIQTLSNAMDVGAPSNFARIKELYHDSKDLISKDIWGTSVSDDQTIASIKEVYERFNYICDPHGAVGYLGLKRYIQKNNNCIGIFHETAHPAKFLEIVQNVLALKLELPKELAQLAEKKKQAILLNQSFPEFKEYLMSR